MYKVFVIRAQSILRANFFLSFGTFEIQVANLSLGSQDISSLPTLSPDTLSWILYQQADTLCHTHLATWSLYNVVTLAQRHFRTRTSPGHLNTKNGHFNRHIFHLLILYCAMVQKIVLQHITCAPGVHCIPGGPGKRCCLSPQEGSQERILKIGWVSQIVF